MACVKTNSADNALSAGQGNSSLSLTLVGHEKLVHIAQCTRKALSRHWVSSPVNNLNYFVGFKIHKKLMTQVLWESEKPTKKTNCKRHRDHPKGNGGRAGGRGGGPPRGKEDRGRRRGGTHQRRVRGTQPRQERGERKKERGRRSQVGENERGHASTPISHCFPSQSMTRYIPCSTKDVRPPRRSGNTDTPSHREGPHHTTQTHTTTTSDDLPDEDPQEEE